MLLEAVRMIIEAVRMIIEAVRKIIEAVKFIIEVVRGSVEVPARSVGGPIKLAFASIFGKKSIPIDPRLGNKWSELPQVTGNNCKVGASAGHRQHLQGRSFCRSRAIPARSELPRVTGNICKVAILSCEV